AGALQIVTNKPDLSISSIQFPEENFLGEEIPVKVAVLNSGLRDSSSFNIALYINYLPEAIPIPEESIIQFTGSSPGKIFAGEKRVVSLPQNSSAEIEFSVDSSLLFPGEYFFEAVVDSSFSVEEQNENNNLIQENLLLSASSDYPDLVIISLDFLPSVEQGESIPVSAKIKNNGLENVSDSFIVSVYDSEGKVLASKIVYGLESGEEKTVSFSVSSSEFSGQTEFSVS
ncbi:MAG: hypothetical protein COU65_04590, partial [Candidatus Pacebacteria bacterium CG10_big_fil_rev_8_21_14_0_10_42_12]